MSINDTNDSHSNRHQWDGRGAEGNGEGRKQVRRGRQGCATYMLRIELQ